jgi:hypothetical protein
MLREAFTVSGVPVLTIVTHIEADAVANIRRVVEEFAI